MIVPSIDIMGGQAVQLVGGQRLELEAGDPLKVAERFAPAGELAVIDLDAALGRAGNSAIIEQLVRRYTGDSDDVFGDTEELLLGYTGMIGYETAQLSIMGGVTGRALITESDLDFGERTTHQLSFRRGVLWCPRLARERDSMISS
jgi:hypothetical protein